MELSISFSGKVLLKGDEKSIRMIFNNIIGKNFKTKKEHEAYLKFASNEVGINLTRDNVKNEVEIVNLSM